jgi:hypothetical protein
VAGRTRTSSTGEKGRGLLRRMRGGMARMEESALDLADIQGFILRDLGTDGATLRVDSESPARAQATRTARKRRRIRRPANHHCRGLARGVAPGPATIPRLPRRKPDYCLNIGMPGPDWWRWATRSVPNLSFRHLVRSPKEPRNERVGWRHRSKCAPTGWRFWTRAGSRPGDAARHQPGSDAELQREVVCLVCRRQCLSKSGADGWR